MKTKYESATDGHGWTQIKGVGRFSICDHPCSSVANFSRIRVHSCHSWQPSFLTGSTRDGGKMPDVPKQPVPLTVLPPAPARGARLRSLALRLYRLGIICAIVFI